MKQAQKRKKGFVLIKDSFDKDFDKTHLDEDLKKSYTQRFKEACELYDFYEQVSPFKAKYCTKIFSSFKEYEKWKKNNLTPDFGEVFASIDALIKSKDTGRPQDAVDVMQLKEIKRRMKKKT